MKHGINDLDHVYAIEWLKACITNLSLAIIEQFAFISDVTSHAIACE
jgi:hypothetical protein